MNFKRAIHALDAEDADPTLASFIVNEASNYMASQGFAELVREHVPQAELDHTAVKRYLAACIAATAEKPTGPEFLTIDEVGRMLSLSVKSVRRRVSDGALPPPIKIGRASRWRRLDIENYRGKYK